MSVVEYCRHDLPITRENTSGRCLEPAIVIVWGKLSDRDELGPRCIEHLPEWLDLGWVDQYAVFDLRGLSESGGDTGGGDR